MIVQETAFARSGLIGNPSDIFGGKVISLLFDRFRATVSLSESPRLLVRPGRRDVTDFADVGELTRYRRQYGYYGGLRLIEATIIRFKYYCDAHGIGLADRNFTLEYDSDIPFGVGLGGSSAITKATLGALLRFHGIEERQIPLQLRPSIILEAETEELGISAGPQDRVVVVYGGLVYMDFTPEAYERNNGLHGHYERLDHAQLPPLFVAWSEKLSKFSGSVHNAMRYRAVVDHDQRIVDTMRRKADLAEEARALIGAGDGAGLGTLLDRDFDLRRSVYTLSSGNLTMIRVARENGSHANNAGSGGAVIGTFEDNAHFSRLQSAFAREGYEIALVRVAATP
jgi:glucuronokinase